MRSAACWSSHCTSALAGLKMAVRTSTSNRCTARPSGVWAPKCAINCWISCSWARRSWGAGSFFCACRPLGAGFFNHEFYILGHQFLDSVVTVDGGLEIGHLFRGDVAGNIAAVFIALVVIVGPVRALAQDTEGAAIQTLDLGDVVEERMRRELGIHGHKYMCITYI